MRSVIKLFALKNIHSHCIVHRDVKPQNILARDGTDFSLYLIISDLQGLDFLGPFVKLALYQSKMLSWNGSRLTEGYPSVFGDLPDYARHLDFDEPIDYESMTVSVRILRSYATWK